MMKNIAYILFSTLLLFSLTAHAEIYRWTDKNGKVHFSDKPISEKAETVDIKVKPVSPVPEQTRDERKQKAENFMRAREEERVEADKKIIEKKKLKAERKVNCKKAKKEYKRISEAGAVYFKNKDGSRDYLEPKRRKKEEALAKAAIEKWCK